MSPDTYPSYHTLPTSLVAPVQQAEVNPIKTCLPYCRLGLPSLSLPSLSASSSASDSTPLSPEDSSFFFLFPGEDFFFPGDFLFRLRLSWSSLVYKERSTVEKKGTLLGHCYTQLYLLF